MKVVVIPIGSAGDVHPFVGLGLALKARGHDVILATNSHFEPLASRVGLELDPLGTFEDFRPLLENPELWRPRKAAGLVLRKVVQLVRPTYQIVARHARGGDCVVVAQSTAFGARVAQEVLGVPVVTTHLQPAMFQSEFEGPILGPLRFDRPYPRLLKRVAYRLIDRFVTDPCVAPEINTFRAEFGLPPVRKVLYGWWNSPQAVLGLFPSWFGPPQPDWPPHVHLAGFPLYDERGAADLPEGLDAFLDAGEPPIAFTPGSAMWHGHAFFEAAVEACQRLGRRGILLTRRPEQVPAALPPAVRYFDYVPFSQLLPRCAALVHHGGVGTCAQGLAAGLPQLVMPLAHDQPDNAARLVRLGVGASLVPRKFRGTRVAAALARLLSCSQVQARCRETAARFRGADTLAQACRVIEDAGQAQRKPSATAPSTSQKTE